MLDALSAGGAPAAGGRGALSGGAAGRAACQPCSAQASPHACGGPPGPGAGWHRPRRCGMPPQSAARPSLRAGAGPRRASLRLRCGRGRPRPASAPPATVMCLRRPPTCRCWGMPDSSGLAGMRSRPVHSCRRPQCGPLRLWSAPPAGHPTGRMRPRSHSAPAGVPPHGPAPASAPRARAARPRDSL